MLGSYKVIMFFIFQIFIYEIFEACAIYKDISVIALKFDIFMVLFYKLIL